ncbi:hypothetical protein MLD52_18070 [Puniceicoccaceae bacterium K14]|nr:hypothetical protein [Puniceicoccaceae bacterium K14]
MKKSISLLSILALTFGAFIGCAEKSESEKAADSMEKAAGQMEKEAESAAKEAEKAAEEAKKALGH